MSLAYLLDPNLQIQNQAGVNNVAGFIRVFMNGTDDRAVTYSDFTGTLNPADIPLDNNGRCVIIADSEGVYRVEVYNRNGGLCWTQYPLTTMAGGGGTSIIDIESTDSSVQIDKTTIGGRVIYDLSVEAEDDPEKLDWIKCVGSTLVDGIYVPQKSAGSMDVGAKGVELEADMLYHAVVSVTASKNAQRMAYYDKISVGLALFDGEATTPVTTASRIVDYSCALSQEFEVCTDIKVGPVPAQLVITVSGQDVQGGAFAISRLDVHRVSSHVAEGGGSFTQVQSDWAQTNSSAVDYIKNKPDLSGFATQTELTQGLAGKQDTISDLATIRSGAAEGATAVQPSDLATVATSGSYNDLSDKPSIPAAQVNSDWNASSGVAEILNKPTLAAVATSGDYTDLTNTPAIPAAQINSDWNASSGVAQILNKPSLATVATSGSYSDLSNTPSIPTATSDLTNDSGYITASDIPAQVNADWNASSGAAEILNKPTIPVVDQTYGAASANAQSGTAVAGALATVNQVPASTSSDEGKVLTVNAQGTPGWATPATPSGGGGDGEWWGGNPGRITLSAQTVRLKFKDLSYDPRNETDTSFMSHFQSITKVEDGVYDFLFASVASGYNVGNPRFYEAFKNKYLVANEFVILAFNFTTATYGKAKNAYSIFEGCTGLCAAYNIQDSDSSQNRNGTLSRAFYGCTNLKYFSVLEKTADPSDYRIDSVNNMSSMFSGCTSLVDCNMEITRIFGTVNCGYMFEGCISLVTGPAIMMGISSATRMFYNCVALTGLHTNYSLGAFDIDPDTTCACSEMFMQCKSLVTADMPFFMYYKMSTLASMFQLCKSLRTPPRHIKVASGVSTTWMFDDCWALESLPTMDYGLVTNATYMFRNCVMLPDISPLSTVVWNASLASVDNMFFQCWSIEKGLKDVYDNMAATATITSHDGTFKGCGTAFSNPELAQIPSSWGGTGA